MSEENQLEKIHELELMIAIEFKRICEKNDIKYFMTAGTLLGAVRHGGFIPWDDDMDFGMLRKDYNHFIEACKIDLNSNYFLQTWDTDSNYPYSFAKIRLNGTHMVEKFTENGYMHDGIFIDVFPFDNVPENEYKRKKQEGLYFICKRILWIKKGFGKNMKEGFFKQVLKYKLFSIFSKVFSYERVKEFYKQIQIKYNNQDSNFVVTDGSYGYKKESIKREWVENLEPIEFEHVHFLSFKNHKDYLQYFYGDYMKLPDEDKRNRHFLKHVDFGEY